MLKGFYQFTPKKYTRKALAQPDKEEKNCFRESMKNNSKIESAYLPGDVRYSASKGWILTLLSNIPSSRRNDEP